MITQPRSDNGQMQSVPVEKRFLSNIQKATSGCIEWTGATSSYGYGQIWFNGRLVQAHHIALMIAGIPIPEGKEVLHSCDNPKCVNVEHLEIGTHKKNMEDAIKRGRWKPRAGWEKMMAKLDYKPVCYGERSPCHKLTLKQVEEIRQHKYERGLFVSLAKKYNVSPDTIGLVYRGKIWKHGNTTLRAKLPKGIEL